MHIGVAAQKPKELVNNGLEVEFLGSEQRETVGQVKTHLVPEDAFRPGARAVVLYGSVVEDVPEEFEVLSHGLWSLLA